MAFDWIKVRTDLYRDPKVIEMSRHISAKDSELSRVTSQYCQRDMTVTLNVTRHAVVGALVIVWGTLRHEGERIDDDLFVENADDFTVDEIADIPGFGAAMMDVGWLVSSPQGLTLPKFFAHHNTDPKEKKRAADRERQARKRERDKMRDTGRDVTRDSHADVTHREEKRREEKSITSNTPLNPPLGEEPKKRQRKKTLSVSDLDFGNLGTDECRKAMARWLEHHKAIGKPYKAASSVNGLLRRYKDRGPPAFVAAVDFSISQNYQGLFDPPSKGIGNATLRGVFDPDDPERTREGTF